MTVSFTIPGRLRGKGRPRFRSMSVKGKTFVRTYTDAKTESGEAVVRSYAAQAMNGAPPMEGALAVEIQVVLNRPQSWSKKKRNSTFYPTGKPDADNQIKLLGDACNGIVWHDDSQISEVNFFRLYDDNGPERVSVHVERLAPPLDAGTHPYPRDPDVARHNPPTKEPERKR